MRGESPYLIGPKPDGGFSFVRLWLVYAAWEAYRRKKITLLTLRVWLSTFELRERRCGQKKGDKNHFSEKEIEGLLGGGGGRKKIRESLRALERLGLLRFSEEKISFPKKIESLRGFKDPELEELRAGLSKIPNNKRKIPAPRRLIRYLSRCGTRTLIAATFGHLMRALYFRGGACRSGGAVKAAWIAEVFSVSIRGVHEARRKLFSLGWIVAIEKPAWHVKRYGKWVVIRLSWKEPREAKSEEKKRAEREGEVPSSAGETADFTPSSAGLDSHTENFLTEEKHQKLPGGEKSGFLKSKERKKEKAPKKTLGKPTMLDIKLEDLKESDRLEALREDAIRREMIKGGERERLEFWTARERALRMDRPEAYFRWIVSGGNFKNLMDSDEKAAEKRLKAYLREKEGQVKLPRAAIKEAKPEGPEDYEIAWRLQKIAARYRVGEGEMFRLVVKKALPTWSEERWIAAVKEGREVSRGEARAYA